MTNAELGALSHIMALTQARDPRVTSKRVVFGTMPFQSARETRERLLLRSDVRARLVAEHKLLSTPKKQGRRTHRREEEVTFGLIADSEATEKGEGNGQIMDERRSFIESWIPVAIALVYRDFGFRKKLSYSVRTGNYQEVENLFGEVMVTLAESVSTFNWHEHGDPKTLQYQFINYLTLALRDCLKINGPSKLHTFSTSFGEEGMVFRAGTDTSASALALVQEWEIKEALSPKAQEIWELVQEGYKPPEIMLQLGISRGVFRRYKQEIDSATRAVYELPLVTGGVHNRSFNRNVIEELRGAYCQRKDLLAPVERKFADAVFACPPDHDLYDFVVTETGIRRSRVTAVWYATRKTLQDAKPDSNRHGRSSRKGPELSKIRVVRQRLLEEIDANPTLKIRMYNALNPTHRLVIELSLREPTLGVKAIAKKLGVSRYVVTNAFERVECLFPEVHARLTALF